MKGSLCREVTIQNKLGIHARAASQIVKLSVRFKAEIYLEKDGVKVNAKSIMGILMLAAPKGSKLKIKAKGDDAAEAVEALTKLIEEDKFFEK